MDTITDFVRYLSDKEDMVASGAKLFSLGAEEDLLAWYLHNGRRFPVGGAAEVVVIPGVWKDFCGKPEVLAKRREDKISYA